MFRLYIVLSFLAIGFYIIWKFFYKNHLKSKRQRELKDLNDISEELETIKIVTFKLIDIENDLSKSIIEPTLTEIIDIQTEILRLYNNNPHSLSENARRLIINYTNSLLNILDKWKTLKEKSEHIEQLQETSEKILGILSKWREILIRIRRRALDKEFDQLDAEIQSMNNGLDLDH